MSLRHLSLLLLSALFLYGCSPNPVWVKEQGRIFGTSYHLVYESPDGSSLHEQVLQSLDSVNQSLSTYDTTSVISRFNNSEKGVKVDNLFNTVYQRASEITRSTDGAFDMTVAPLVNAWGFGFTLRQSLTPQTVDSLKAFVGMHHLKLKGNYLTRSRNGVMIDASAIAKGFGVDMAGATLHRLGCENYMIEIGGEVVTQGINPKGKKWRIGIDKPIDEPMAINRELQLIIEISNLALATSGNYRQFYYDEKGKKVAHTINPVTGYPVEHSLLSATVIANDCMTADAYATACMVMGLEKSMNLMENHPEMEACFIYDANEGLKVAYTEGFDKYIAE